MSMHYSFYIVPNDGVALPATLTKDGATFSISESATVKAAIVSADHSVAYTDAVAQSPAAGGADWSQSALVISMTPAQLAGLQALGRRAVVAIEIQVSEPGEGSITWYYGPGLAEVGHIE